MYLIKILGNDKTNNLCFNFRYNTIGVAMNDKAQVDDILALIDDINQPITMNLASILQLACQFATDTEVVSYLLSLNANPNYLDANAADAYDYSEANINGIYFLAPISTLTTKRFHRIIEGFGIKLYIPNGRIKFSSIAHETEEAPAFGCVIFKIQHTNEIEFFNITSPTDTGTGTTTAPFILNEMDE